MWKNEFQEVPDQMNEEARHPLLELGSLPVELLALTLSFLDVVHLRPCFVVCKGTHVRL